MGADPVAVPARVSELDLAFPPVDPGVVPLGSRLLVQIRGALFMTKSGLIIPQDTRDTEKWNTQVAKVISVGPLAFKNRESMKQWPEGAWVQPGDFVRVSKYGGDRFELDAKVYGHDDKVMFVILNDLDIIAKLTGDPLKVKAFI